MTGLVQSLAAAEIQKNNQKQEHLVKNGPIAKAATGQNQSCGLCRAIKNVGQCKGHGGNSGGNGSGTGKDEKYEPTKNMAIDPAKKAQAEQLKNWIKNFMFVGEADHLSHTNELEYESDLFTLHSNKLKGTLILRPKPNLSAADKEDFEEYVKAIKSGFHEFKDMLAKLGIDVSKFKVEETENQVTLTIPARHFGDFLQYLGKLNLLPEMKPAQNAGKALDDQEEEYARAKAGSHR